MAKSMMQEAWIKSGLNPDEYSWAVGQAMQVYAKPFVDMLEKIYKIPDLGCELKSEIKEALDKGFNVGVSIHY